MKRNSCLDAGRIAAAFLVVCLHLPIYWLPARQVLGAVVDCAVPFFMLASGYLLYPVERDRAAIRARAAHIARLLLVWLAVNLAFFALAYRLQGVFDQFVETVFSLESLYRSLFIVGGIPYAGHLWFLLQLVVNYLLALLALRAPAVRGLWLWLPLAPLLTWLAGIVSVPALSGAVAFGNTLSLLLGGSWFFLGRLLACRERDIRARISPRLLSAVSVSALVGCILFYQFHAQLSITLALFERMTFLLLNVALFLLCLYHPSFASRTLLPRWGRDYSLPVYLLHVMMMEVYAKLCSWFPAFLPVFTPAAPLFIFFSCVALAAVGVRGKRALAAFRTARRAAS